MPDKPKILVTRRLPEAVEDRLRRDYDALLNEADAAYDTATIIERAGGCDGLLPCPADAINADVINGLPQSIKIIATFSVGFEHIDCEAAKARGMAVTNTPGVLTQATADLTLLLILAASRRAFEGQDRIRRDTWSGWTPTQLMGAGLQGKRLGILGMGRIGQAVALRARAFGMEIHYHKRNRLDAGSEGGAVFHDTADGLLGVSDVLSIHCPLTPETMHFLNSERIARLPDGAVVVNTARGPVVDDAALIDALKSGKVSAAGLDVFEGEPAINPGYRALKNAYLLPHLGSATVETRNAMGFKALDNLDAFFAGKKPPDRVA